MSKYWLPWLVGMPAETATAICSLLMGGVLNRFPRLKVCFAHGGGSFPFTVGRIQHGYNVRPDLCATDCPVAPKEFLGKFWTDSLVHDQGALKLLLEVIGEDRVMLGTDYPFPLGEVLIADTFPGKVVTESGLSSNLKVHTRFKNLVIHLFSDIFQRKIFWDNAMEFLNLDSSKY